MDRFGPTSVSYNIKFPFPFLLRVYLTKSRKDTNGIQGFTVYSGTHGLEQNVEEGKRHDGCHYLYWWD